MTAEGNAEREALAARPSRPGPLNPDRAALDVIRVPIKQTTIDFTVRPGGSGPALFSLGVRKSGSSMFHRIVNFLSIQNDVNVVDIPGRFFGNGFTAADWAALDLSNLIAPANLYTGFRSFPAELANTGGYREGLKVFMFRDPRDALISQYFSDAYSHKLPKADAAGDGRELFLKKREEARNADIDTWVLDKAGGIRRTLREYRGVLADPNCLVLRYEDYVFQKRRMIGKILAHFGWTIEPGSLARLLDDIDVVPAAEEKTRFIRRVIPGDHTAKLRPETICGLNRKLSDVLATYDYY